MKIFVFGFLTVFVHFCVHVKADKPSKVLCNEELMEEIHALVSKIPTHIAEEIEACIQEQEPDLATEEVTVKCHTGVAVRQIPARYYNIVQHPLEFAQCGSSVTQTMEEMLSSDEKQNLASIEEEGMRIFDKVSSMY